MEPGGYAYWFLAVTPDGERLLCSDSVFSRGGELLETLPGFVTAMAPDGRFLLLSGLGGLGKPPFRIYDVVTGEVVELGVGRERLLSLPVAGGWSNDMRYLVVG